MLLTLDLCLGFTLWKGTRIMSMSPGMVLDLAQINLLHMQAGGIEQVIMKLSALLFSPL